MVIYNNQNSGYELYEAVHAHYELKLVGSLTFGYEIWVFKLGWFQPVGDGGVPELGVCRVCDAEWESGGFL